MNNVLKPILLGRGVKAPMAVIFIGAVVFVLGYTLFMVWLDEADTEDSKSIAE